MHAEEVQEGVFACVLDFPTSRIAALVSGRSRGSGSHADHPHPLGQRMENPGQSNSLIGHVAGNRGWPGSGSNTHWSEMGIF